MHPDWLREVDEQLERDIRGNFIESKVIRKRLTEILEKKIRGSTEHSRLKVLYENPNWNLLKADQNGYERAFSEIIKLIV
jgi:hypothetical protein